jgi:hypothetical protein
LTWAKLTDKFFNLVLQGCMVRLLDSKTGCYFRSPDRIFRISLVHKNLAYMDPDPAPPPPGTGIRWVLLGLWGALWWAYSPALHGQPVWDDSAWLGDLKSLKADWSGLGRIWTDPTAMQQYYPTSGSSFWLDEQLWGSWHLPYHLENLLLHAVSVGLLWQLLTRLRVKGALIASAFFALHPMMVESVAWITERKNVLSMALMLGGLLVYVRAAQKRGIWPATGESPPSLDSSTPVRSWMKSRP